MCFNTEGSYFCTCREGFILHSDKQSCKMVNTQNTALEADEMDNEVDYDEINNRIGKLEEVIIQFMLIPFYFNFILLLDS